jgi:hypothetical protein
MPTFTVDVATLEALSGTLSSIHSEMEGMRGTVDGYEGLLGGPDLEGEVEHFCGHWNYGLHQLSDHMSKVVAKLNAAAAAYGKSEAEIGQACRTEAGR